MPITRTTEIESGSKLRPNQTPVEVLEIGNPGMPGVLIIHNGMLYIYNQTGETLIDGGIIQTEAILANSITVDKLTIGSYEFTHNIVWTATDIDTCTWSSGTIRLANSTSMYILSGNTGNIAATTYIYYNGTTVLQTTTDPAVAIGDTKRLLAIIELGQTDGKCVITPFNSGGTTIDANKIVTGRVQSVDGKTYFDLNGRQILVNDGSNDRILIGKL